MAGAVGPVCRSCSRAVPLAPVGAAALLAGWAYTGGPYPLAYHGLGDLFVVLFFGLVAVAGTSYAQAGVLELRAGLVGLGVGLLCDNLLVVNNVRDVGTDAAVAKRTLVVRFGTRFARVQYAFQAVLAFALPFALGGKAVVHPLSAPLALWAGTRFARAREGSDFNERPSPQPRRRCSRTGLR